MKVLKITVFFMSFCVDVHVKAEGWTSACWSKSTPCAVQALSGREVLKDDGVTLVVGAGGVVERRQKNLVQLVSGSFYVDVNRPVVFQTPFGKAWCSSTCKALFERSMDVWEIRALEGVWQLRRQGEKQDYALVTGLSLRLSEVNSSGFAEMEFPESLPWLPTVKSWAALFPGTLDELKPHVEGFRKSWFKAVEAASSLHQHTVAREIASYEQTLAERRAEEFRRAQEDQKLRDLFREKNP